ncbi:MAG: PAS domain-containing protein [Actinomycetota bacterium]
MDPRRGHLTTGAHDPGAPPSGTPFSGSTMASVRSDSEFGLRDLERILRILAALTISSALIILVTSGPSRVALQPALLGFAHLLAIALARRSGVRIGVTFVLTIWMAVATFATLMVDGLSGPAASIPLAMVAMASVALGRAGVGLTGAAAAVFYIGFFLLERTPDRLPERIDRTLEELLVIRIGVLGFVLIVILTALAGRDRMEETATQQNEALRSFYESVLGASPVIVTVNDLDLNQRIYTSEAFRRLAGIDAGSDTDSRDWIHPNDVDTVRDAVSRFIETDGREGATVRHRFHTPRGWRWYLLSTTVLSRRPDGSIQQIVHSGTDITDELQASDLSRRALEASPAMFVIFDHDTGHVDFANPAHLAITGYTPAQLSTMDAATFARLIPPEDADALIAARRAAIAGRGSEVVRHRLRCADGTVRWLEVQFTRLDRSDPDSSLLLMAGIDVTPALTAESLRDTVLDTSSTIYAIFHNETGLLDFANAAYTEATGLSLEERNALDREDWSRLIHQDDILALEQTMADAQVGREPGPVVYRTRRPDGSYRWIHAEFKPLGDAELSDGRLFCSARDITDTVEAQAFAESILSSTPALTVVFDPIARTTTYVNPSFENHTGHTAEALNDMSAEQIGSLTPYPDRTMVNDAVASAFETGEIVELERAYRSASGELRWYDCRFVRLPTAEPRVLISGIDTTNRKQTERELEAHRLHLERVNRDLRDFVHIASHDLQEPLRTLTGFTQILNEELAGDLDRDAETALDYVNRGVGRMRDLVSGLSSYSRVGANRDVTLVDAAAVAQEVLDDLGDLVARERASVRVGALPELRADPIELRLIFQNLIANAIKFRRADRAVVVSIDAERDGRRQWRFTVRDNGIGIAEEHQDRIFAIFRRLHDRGEYEGTGVGLANCKRAVENHGGSIGVDSTVGRGSTFWFTIPDEAQHDRIHEHQQAVHDLVDR